MTLQIPRDKLLHLLAGIAITACIGVYSIHIGVIVGILAGLGKEAYDYVSGKGCVEILDAICTILGSLLVYAVYMVYIAIMGVL